MKAEALAVDPVVLLARTSNLKGASKVPRKVPRKGPTGGEGEMRTNGTAGEAKLQSKRDLPPAASRVCRASG